jgi:D-alanine-D-alanine ligase
VGPYLEARRHDWDRDAAAIRRRVRDELGYPVFVKPANLGSSVGISKAKSDADFITAMELALQFDRKTVVEAGVPNAREIECAVLGNDEPEASLPGEVIPSREFYDYEAKYLDDSSKTVIPAALGASETAEVRRMAIEAFKAVEGSGMARVDFFLSRDTGTLFVNEVNTIPGFTTISMYPKMWEASGVPYPALLDRLIQLAIERHTQKRQLRTSITDGHP